MARSTLERRIASFAASLPVINSLVRGASKNIYSGVTTFCRFASACGSFLPSDLGAATLVIGSPCGFVFCWGSNASLIVAPLDCIALPSPLAFSLHLLGRVAECRRAARACRRRHEGHRISMSLAVMNFRLSSGESYIFTVIRQLNAHLFTNFLEDLGGFSQLQRVRIANGQHGIFMPLLGANRHGAAVRPCANHLQREIGIVTVNTDENAGFNLIAPNHNVGMVRIDNL